VTEATNSAQPAVDEDRIVNLPREEVYLPESVLGTPAARVSAMSTETV